MTQDKCHQLKTHLEAGSARLRPYPSCTERPGQSESSQANPSPARPIRVQPCQYSTVETGHYSAPKTILLFTGHFYHPLPSLRLRLLLLSRETVWPSCAESVYYQNKHLKLIFELRGGPQLQARRARVFELLTFSASNICIFDTLLSCVNWKRSLTADLFTISAC